MGVSSLCGLGGAGASRVTCLGHVTGLGVLLDLRREQLCTLAMVEPTEHQRVGPAPGTGVTTQSPGKPLHPWHLRPLPTSGAYSSLSVTPEMLALCFLCFPQTHFVALPSLHNHFPLALLAAALSPTILLCTHQKLCHLCSLYKIPSLICSNAFNLLLQPSEEKYFSHRTPVVAL